LVLAAKNADDLHDSDGTSATLSGTFGKNNWRIMTTLSTSILLLLTIVAAFAFGVAAGYWVICGFLNLMNPRRSRPKPARSTELAPTASGD
jgi:hypothetical protein